MLRRFQCVQAWVRGACGTVRRMLGGALSSQTNRRDAGTVRCMQSALRVPEVLGESKE